LNTANEPGSCVGRKPNFVLEVALVAAGSGGVGEFAGAPGKVSANR
jgi:hypothetical protein